jgi:hypothetical protein
MRSVVGDPRGVGVANAACGRANGTGRDRDWGRDWGAKRCCDGSSGSRGGRRFSSEWADVTARKAFEAAARSRRGRDWARKGRSPLGRRPRCDVAGREEGRACGAPPARAVHASDAPCLAVVAQCSSNSPICLASASCRSCRRPRTGPCQHGGSRAGARGGGSVGSPRWLRNLSTFFGSVTRASRRMRAPQRGQVSTSRPKVLRSSSAHAR